MNIAVAIVVDDQVIALCDDPAAVRVAAGLIASSPIEAEPPLLRPIAAGRRQTCRQIATGAC